MNLENGTTDTFAADAVTFFSRRRAGAMSAHIYSASQHEQDAVNGADLWERLVEESDFYTIPTEEPRVLARAAAAVGRHCAGCRTVVELGPGSVAAIREKSAPLLRAMPAARRYVPVDLSEQFLASIGPALEAEFPDLRCTPILQSFASGELDVGGTPQPRIVLYLGTTIANQQSSDDRPFSDNPGALRQLRGMRQSLAAGDFALVTFDSQQDEATLMRMYGGPLMAELELNVFHRFRRDLDADLDPEAFRYEPRWDPGPRVLRQCAIATSAQTVSFGGHAFEVRPGDVFVTTNSFKPTAADFERACDRTGWRLVELVAPGDTALRAALLARGDG